MFEVRVKTLDGQNTAFNVEDEITVKEFKQLISTRINIPEERQRLIFTGKVLADETKLKSYNVADKVIHVVARTPPGMSTPSNQSTQADDPQPAQQRHQQQGASFSMSSLPSNIADDVMSSMMQNIPGGASVHHFDLRRQSGPPPTHTESGRRVVLIRQWIRDSNTLLDRIRDHRQSTRLSSDTLSGEAREAATVHPHVHSEQVSISLGGQVAGRPHPLSSNRAQPPSSSSTPESRNRTPVQAPRNSQDSPNHQPAPAGSNSTSAAREQTANAPPPQSADSEVLVALWREIDALNARLNPHMHRYRQLIASNTQPRECPRSNQHVYDIVCSVLHNISHIYHAVSDMMCDLSKPAPRELTALQPALPPPTAIIQQTIPVTIPLRATVNLSPSVQRRNRTGTTPTTATQARPTPTPPTNQSTSDGQPTNNQSTPSPTVPAANQSAAGRSNGQVDMDIHVDMNDMGGGTSQQPGTANQPFPGLNINELVQNLMQGMGGAMPPPGAVPEPGAHTAQLPPGVPMPPAGFLPPAGSATPANGPMPAPPGMQGQNPMTRDRQDPYLATCISRHWCHPTSGSTRPANSSDQSPSRPQQNRPAPQRSHTIPQRAQDTSLPTTETPGSTTSSQTPPSSGTGSRPVTSGLQRVEQGAPSGYAMYEDRDQGITILENIVPGQAAVIHPHTSTGSAAAVIPPSHAASQEEQLMDQVFRNLTEVFLPQTNSRLNRMTSELRNDLKLYREKGQKPRWNLLDVHRTIETELPGNSYGPPRHDLFTELSTLLATHLSLPHLFTLYTGSGSALDCLRQPLRQFVRTVVLEDGPSTDLNIRSAVSRLMVPVRESITMVTQNSPSQQPGVDLTASLCSLVHDGLLSVVQYVLDSKAGTLHYGQTLLDKLQHILLQFARLVHHCLADAEDSSISLITSLLAVLTRGVNSHLIDWIRATATVILTTSNSPLTQLPLSDIDNFVVEAASDDSTAAPDNAQAVEMDTQPSPAEVVSEPTNSASAVVTDLSTLGQASDWRTIVPADWVPIIEEDIKKQMQAENLASSQQPLSDAYTSGGPGKKRRVTEDDA